MSEVTKQTKDARQDKISRAKRKLRNFQEKRSSRGSSRGPSPVPQFNLIDPKTVIDFSSIECDDAVFNGEAESFSGQQLEHPAVGVAGQHVEHPVLPLTGQNPNQPLLAQCPEAAGQRPQDSLPDFGSDVPPTAIQPEARTPLQMNEGSDHQILIMEDVADAVPSGAEESAPAPPQSEAVFEHSSEPDSTLHHLNGLSQLISASAESEHRFPSESQQLRQPHSQQHHLQSQQLPQTHLRDPHLRDSHLRDPHPQDPRLHDPHLHDPHLQDPHLRDPHLHDLNPQDPYLQHPHLQHPYLQQSQHQDFFENPQQPQNHSEDNQVFQSAVHRETNLDGGHFCHPSTETYSENLQHHPEMPSEYDSVEASSASVEGHSPDRSGTEDVDMIIEAVQEVDRELNQRYSSPRNSPSSSPEQDSPTSLQMLNEISSQVNNLLSESPLNNNSPDAEEYRHLPPTAPYVPPHPLPHPHPLQHQAIPSTFTSRGTAGFQPLPDHSIPLSVISPEEPFPNPNQVFMEMNHHEYQQHRTAASNVYEEQCQRASSLSPVYSPKHKMSPGSPGPRSLKNRKTSPMDSPHLGRSPSLPRRANGEVGSDANGVQDEVISPRLQELHEQLQVHIQTIGILVSEKTDLQSQLQQSSVAINKKRDDLEEVSGRLFASRERVAELEKVLNLNQRTFEANDLNLKHLRDDVSRLQVRLEDTTTSNDDLYLHNQQLKEKLDAQENELAVLTQEVEDWENKHQRLEVKFEQSQQFVLDEENNQKVEKKPSSETLVHENAFLQANIQQLQAQLNHYTASFQNLVSERDTLAQQYQNHCNQMKNHAHDLENHLQEEKEFRSSTETELKEKMAEIADLSLQLESIQEQSLMQEAKEEKDDKSSVSSDGDQKNETQKNLDESLFIIQQLQAKSEEMTRENTDLQQALEDENFKVSELRDQLMSHQTDVGDRQRLLLNIENDKQALSRALAQNKELKNQLTEMQEGFVKLSQENCKLVNQVQAEQHATKDVKHTLKASEESLQRLTLEFESKEKAREEKQTNEANKQLILRNQDEETSLHFGANQMLIDTLQDELSGAQATINALSIQNSELRQRISGLEIQNSSISMETKDDDAVNQLQTERDALLNRYEDTEEKCKALRIQLETMRKHIESTTANTSLVVDCDGKGMGNEDSERLAEQILEMESEEGTEDVVDMQLEAVAKDPDLNPNESVMDEELEHPSGSEVTAGPAQTEETNPTESIEVATDAILSESSSETTATPSEFIPNAIPSEYAHAPADPRPSSPQTNEPAFTNATVSESSESNGGDVNLPSADVSSSSSSMDEEERVEERPPSKAVGKCDASVQSSPSESSDSDAETLRWKSKYDVLNVSMEKLTQKFMGTMRLNAELEDKAQRLEHVVAQLEGETETIGDYISLYHSQRSAMRSRAEEKDMQIVTLVREKQFMQEKVVELQKWIDLQHVAKAHDFNNEINHNDSLETPFETPTASRNRTESLSRNEAESVESQEGFSTSQVTQDINEFMEDGESTEDTTFEAGSRAADVVDVQQQAMLQMQQQAMVQMQQQAMVQMQQHPQLQQQQRRASSLSPAHSSKEISPRYSGHRDSLPDDEKSLWQDEGETALRRIRHILSEMAETAGTETQAFANLEFYPCKCCHGRLMNV